MFDVSFGEMVVVGVVALVVIGPERLPKVARTVGSFVGKAQRYANQVRNDINAQIELEELRKTQQEIRDAAQQFEQSISQEIKAAETEVAQIHQQVEELRADLEHSVAVDEHASPDSSNADANIPSEAAPTAIAPAQEERGDAEEQAFRSRQMELFAEPPSTQANSTKTG